MKKILLTFILFLCISNITLAKLIPQDGWYLHSHWGASNSVPSVMSIKTNETNVVHNARWNGRSFQDSWYYNVKFEKWTNQRVRGWEWVHHKMYLANLTPFIQEYSISDGYNMAFYNIGKQHENGLITKIGFGIVIGHPDITLQGRERFFLKGGVGGQYFAGFAAQYSIQKWLYETTRHVFSIEGKLTAGYSRVPVSTQTHEFSEVPHIGYHFSLGLGSKPMPMGERSLVDYLHFYLVPFIHHYSIYWLD